MSIMAERNVYESIVDDGLSDKFRLVTSEPTNELMFIPKVEHNDKVAMGMCEQVMDECGMDADGVEDSYDRMKSSPVFFEDACEEVIDFKPPEFVSAMLCETKMEEDWEDRYTYKSPTMESSFEESMSYHDENESIEDPDEETIATFLTAAGQRLALYAVEDSDDVFAVAVYDESGDPPTNFQFLMKSDVERLIGEGAVRTVRKPSQMKKQVFNSDPPRFTQQMPEEYVETQVKNEIQTLPEYDVKTSETHYSWNENIEFPSNDMEENSERMSSPIPEANGQPDFTFVMSEDTSKSLDESEEKENDAESENEFVQQSTVQYILLDNENSDSELTFDDIEQTLRNLKSYRDKSLSKKTVDADTLDNNRSLNGVTMDALREDRPKITTSVHTKSNLENSVNSMNKSYKNLNSIRKSHMSSSLICRRENCIDERQNVMDALNNSLGIDGVDDINTDEPAAPESTPVCLKAKRPRKQQLTSVNRGDSEIIIQPADFLNEEDETCKKRGRRKRRVGRPAVYKTKAVMAKKIRKIQRLRPVEVIEIDVDEDDRLQGQKDIVEITIDDNKEKGSSDKENEVIMVGDSDDEEQEAETMKMMASILKCEYCTRSFRQKRALETHSRVCPKSPDTLRRLSERSARRSSCRSNESAVMKKQYMCKVCQEKFDVVVALARHVRLVHSQRKRVHNSGQSTSVTKPESPSKTEESTKKSQAIVTKTKTRKKKKRVQGPNQLWRTKKLHCTNCGKWFTSAALLTAHCLQHATKNSDKQTRRCQTCMKLFKSRLLYIRHMRIHSRARQLQKKLHHTRQTTSKRVAALRKRERPRKL